MSPASGRAENRHCGRRRAWIKNCVALGLASGFIEPLESTSIHLIQRGITRLLQMFPHAAIAAADVEEYNRQTSYEIEHIRDLIVLQYNVTERVFRIASELFAENSWIQVMLGQGIVPRQHHPVVNIMSDEELSRFLQNIKSSVDATVSQLPKHEAYVKQYCPAES